MVHIIYREKYKGGKDDHKKILLSAVRRVVFVMTFVFFSMASGFFSRKEVFASDLSNSGVINEITGRMLAGLPTTLDEQLGVSAPALSTPTLGGTGYIIIGDSRMTSLNATCRVNDTVDNWFVVACAGTHFNYLPDIAIPTCDAIEQAHPEISHWKYLINMGLTDLDKPKKYADYLTALSTYKDVYFVSINPTSKTATTNTFGMTNKRISAFNAAVMAAGVKYIDTYSCLLSTGYKTVEDGFHYDPNTTRAIFQALKILSQ